MVVMSPYAYLSKTSTTATIVSGVFVGVFVGWVFIFASPVPMDARIPLLEHLFPSGTLLVGLVCVGGTALMVFWYISFLFFCVRGAGYELKPKHSHDPEFVFSYLAALSFFFGAFVGGLASLTNYGEIVVLVMDGAYEVHLFPVVAFVGFFPLLLAVTRPRLSSLMRKGRRATFAPAQARKERELLEETLSAEETAEKRRD